MRTRVLVLLAACAVLSVLVPMLVVWLAERLGTTPVVVVYASLAGCGLGLLIALRVTS